MIQRLVRTRERLYSKGMVKERDPNLMEKVINLARNRGFIFPGSEIYGGLANSYDLGPLGTELKRNIKDLWWKTFVQKRSDVGGIDAGIIMNAKVWEASGHLKEFSDTLVECKKCHNRFRLDELIENTAQVPIQNAFIKYMEDWYEDFDKNRFKPASMA